MRECDCFMAILPGAPDGKPVRTDGTSVELGWASSMGKKIIIVHSPDVTYSHLVAGLPAIADVTFVDVDDFMRSDFDISNVVSGVLQEARYQAPAQDLKLGIG